MMNKSPFTQTAGVLVLHVVFASSTLAADSLDEMSLEDLTKTEITSVSRKNQSLSNVPAAAFVISSEDIRRSGAQAIPDVLRMAPGIEVAQIDNGRYAVSARGFNGRFSNKLQVLIDGRSIYLPTFSGVMWENDPIALDDIERIEVIRGAGAAVWGVNAVSGVINIISKHSRDQTGGLVVPTVGTQGKSGLYARYGAQLDENTSWKMSIQGRHADPSKQAANGAEAEDRLSNAALDIRSDKKLGGGSELALWANAFNSSLGDSLRAELVPGPPPTVRPFAIEQENTSQTVAGRYRWLTNQGIESSLQFSLNQTRTEIKGFFKEDRNTYDIDYHGRYTFDRHDVLWGLSHRTTSDDIFSPSSLMSFSPTKYTQHTSGIFVHDDWTLIPNTLQLGVGARWDDSNLGGQTLAPSASLMWTPTRSDTLWAKYAQAPRLPSRAEQTVNIYSAVRPAVPPFQPAVVVRSSSDGSLKAETMEGVELGYRSQLSSTFNIDLTGYRYRYTGVVGGRAGSQSFEYWPLAVTQNVNLYNAGKGWITGAELAADWLVVPTWRLQLSYSWTHVEMDESSNPLVQGAGINDEVGTPGHYGSLRSQWNISANQQFDAWVRGSAGYDVLNAPFTDLVHVPGYVTLDLRYAQKLSKDVELAVTGRNLIGGKRTEFVSDYLPSVPVEITPSLLISARWKF